MGHESASFAFRRQLDGHEGIPLDGGQSVEAGQAVVCHDKVRIDETFHTQALLEQVAEELATFATHGIDRHAAHVLEHAHVRPEVVHLVALQPLTGKVVDKAAGLGVFEHPLHLSPGFLGQGARLGGVQQFGIRGGIPEEIGQAIGSLHVG